MFACVCVTCSLSPLVSPLPSSIDHFLPTSLLPVPRFVSPFLFSKYLSLPHALALLFSHLSNLFIFCSLLSPLLSLPLLSSHTFISPPLTSHHTGEGLFSLENAPRLVPLFGSHLHVRTVHHYFLSFYFILYAIFLNFIYLLVCLFMYIFLF